MTQQFRLKLEAFMDEKVSLCFPISGFFFMDETHG